MFGFIKKVRQEKAKREALEIGHRAVENFNDALSRWRELSLESRRAMVDNDFAERLLSLDLDSGLCFETVAEIEALACIKNWIEGEERYHHDFAQMVDADAMQCLAVIGAEAEAGGHIQRNINEVTAEIEQDLDISIAEALMRRGETPRRHGRRKLAERSVQEFGYLESLTLLELMAEAREMASSEPVLSSMTPFMRRFYDIAFFEHGISAEERSAALATAQAFEADIVASLSDNDEGLTAFLEAVEHHKEHGRVTGIGSLHWKMEDEGVPADELIAYIARVEHAPLLPDYLSMLDADVIAQIRNALLGDIVAARQAVGQNSTEALVALVESNDPSIELLLESGEIHLLKNWTSNQEQAQQLVSQLLRLR
jgi:hypothetical protein